MASPRSSTFQLEKEQYLTTIKNQLKIDQRIVMKTQVLRGLGWTAISLWPLFFPGIRSFLFGMILLVLFGVGIPIKAILNVRIGFAKLNKFAEELLNEGEIHEVVLETSFKELQSYNHKLHRAILNGKEIEIMTNRSYYENDTIKVLYHKNYPEKALPVDHIEKGEFNLIFQFNEDEAGLIVPATDGFSGVTP